MFFQISANIANSNAELVAAVEYIDAAMDECTMRSLIRASVLARSSGIDTNQIETALELFLKSNAFTVVNSLECEGCSAVAKLDDVREAIEEHAAFHCSRCDHSLNANSFDADVYVAVYYFDPALAKRIETQPEIPSHKPEDDRPGKEDANHDLSPAEVKVITELFESCFDSPDAVMDFVLESCARPLSHEIETRTTRSAIRTLREKAHNQALLGEVLVDLASEFENKRGHILAIASHIQDKYDQVRKSYAEKALALTTNAIEQSLDLGRPDFLEKATSLNPFLDMTELQQWCEQAVSRVCRVRGDGEDYGTGFLVGPNLVMTCFHVVQDFVDADQREFLSVCFDAASENDAPTVIAIDPGWDIPFSKSSEMDLRDNPGIPAAGELDFALLKLTDDIGEDHGFFQLRDNIRTPRVGEPILIAGHPGPTAPLQELKFSMAAPGFESINENRTRMVYKTSTLKGSSGSPVFDRQFRLIGLHHNRGEKDGRFYANNRGVPIKTICKYLEESTWPDCL